jgi:3-deoxy-D-manno-octulosonate 8-phosphate phosphatase (KDO 8-P phosphatase)
MPAPFAALRSRLQRLAVGRKLAAVQLLVCDVDGVLTDGGLHYDGAGQVVKRFNVRDGLAIRMLQRAGIEVALLSGGRSGAIEQRARHLHIQHCRAGVGDKLAGLQELQAEVGASAACTAFIGDDLNDLAVRPATALLVAPADAASALRRRADWVLRSPGGHGAVRELAEALLQSRGALRALHHGGWREGNG